MRAGGKNEMHSQTQKATAPFYIIAWLASCLDITSSASDADAESFLFGGVTYK